MAEDGQIERVTPGSVEADLASVRTYIEIAQEKPDDPRSLRYALNALEHAEQGIESAHSSEIERLAGAARELLEAVDGGLIEGARKHEIRACAINLHAALRDSVQPDSEDREARCSCEEWRKTYAEAGERDPNCPVHGRPKRCPDCKSKDPAKREKVVRGTVSFPLLIDCPDPWHLHGEREKH